MLLHPLVDPPQVEPMAKEVAMVNLVHMAADSLVAMIRGLAMGSLLQLPQVVTGSQPMVHSLHQAISSRVIQQAHLLKVRWPPPTQ